LDETARRDVPTPTPWGRLTRRAQFQRAAKGRRSQATAFTLQANARAATDPAEGPRVGLTVTKKIGNSPARNRIRRRLREALRQANVLEAAPNHDYVLMARDAALTIGFAALVGEIDRALAQVRRMKPRAMPAEPRRDERS
jgi:ribonuclease P protein component